MALALPGFQIFSVIPAPALRSLGVSGDAGIQTSIIQSSLDSRFRGNDGVGYPDSRFRGNDRIVIVFGFAFYVLRYLLAASPAARPVAQEAWRLKPPVKPSTLRI